MKTVDCIMLIDDNQDDNFFHERVIRKSNAAKSIIVKDSGTDALDYLSTVHDAARIPDLIFLDINMPGMNGWEFLEAYNQLPEDKFKKHVIVMLTTSENPDDRKMAQSMEAVSNFQTKPLTREALEDILTRYVQ